MKSNRSGFTMIEIAISLAIIGIALVSIIGILPIGLNTQRDNREETIINQDATVLMEAIRGGAHGLDDLTNYVYAITNYWTNIPGGASGVNVYTHSNGFVAPGYPFVVGFPLTNGANIVGVLSTPEYLDADGVAVPTLLFGGISNHITAYVRSMSGPAVEKPPQDNDLLRGDSFSYRILCVNAPMAFNTNIFNGISLWTPGIYGAGALVYYRGSFWQPQPVGTNTPGLTADWAASQNYTLAAAANLHDIRLTFLWPQRPNGSIGPGRLTFRTSVAGRFEYQALNNSILYFIRSQSFEGSK